MTKTSLIRGIACPLLFLVVRLSIAAEQGNSAKTWDCEGIVGTGENCSPILLKFALQVCDDGRWHMRVANANDEFENGSELAWDRTNLFVLAHRSGGTIELGNKTQNYEETGHIYRNTFPKDLNETIGSVWWLLCSPYVLGFNVETNCPSVFRFMSLPKTIFYRQVTPNSNSRLGLQEGALFLVPPKSAEEHPFCTLHVLSLDETNGIAYPRLTKVERFDIYKLDTNGRPESVVAYTIKCEPPTAVSTPITFKPAINRLASIVDVREENHLTEYIGQEWLDENAIQELTKVGQAFAWRKAEPAMTPPKSKSRVLVFLFLGCAGLVFLISIFRRKSIQPEKPK